MRAMRAMRWAVLAAVTAVAVSQLGAAPEPMPRSRDGWWSAVLSNTAGTQSSHECSGPGADAIGAALDLVTARGMGCAPVQPVRTAEGWLLQSVCKVNGVTMETSATVTGDVETGFHIAGSTGLNPVPNNVPPIQSFTYDGRWLRAQCEPGTKPGDFVTSTDG